MDGNSDIYVNVCTTRILQGKGITIQCAVCVFARRVALIYMAEQRANLRNFDFEKILCELKYQNTH